MRLFGFSRFWRYKEYYQLEKLDILNELVELKKVIFEKAAKGVIFTVQKKANAFIDFERKDIKPSGLIVGVLRY